MPLDRPRVLDPAVAARLKRDAHGLVAAVAQQWDTGEVLMLGWMDDEALHRTLTTGRATYWSRSPARTTGARATRRATSSWSARCASTATATRCSSRSTRSGAACHTGDRTCFDAGLLVADGDVQAAS